jgi:hypothetical protein
VHYSRRAEVYPGQSVYRPIWLGLQTLLQVIRSLADAELLEIALGERNGRRSTFAATPLLLDAMAAFGVGTWNVCRDGAAAPVIHLKNIRKNLTEYDPTSPEIVALSEPVQQFNSFLADHFLWLDIAQDEEPDFLGNLQSRRRRQPNLSEVALYRVFNDGSLESGGRFFGGWWQFVPSGWRDRITIDAQPTVELDFSGFASRAIYHHEGIDYHDDPYDITEVRQAAESQGLQWSGVRESVKLLFQKLINSEPDDRINARTGLTLPKGFPPRAIYPLIRRDHGQIEHFFQMGFGLKIMNIESKICQGVLSDGVAYGVPILPIHDSFIVTEENKDWLYQSMMNNYKKILNFDPVIHQSCSKARCNV